MFCSRVGVLLKGGCLLQLDVLLKGGFLLELDAAWVFCSRVGVWSLLCLGVLLKGVCFAQGFVFCLRVVVCLNAIFCLRVGVCLNSMLRGCFA